MALWRCGDCTTLYAVGLSRCPRCRSTNTFEEGTMAKIGRLTGPSNAALQEAQAAAALAAEGGDQPSPGSNSEASTPKPQPSTKPSKPAARSRARTTESPSSPDPTADSSAASTDGGPTASSDVPPAK